MKHPMIVPGDGVGHGAGVSHYEGSCACGGQRPGSGVGPHRQQPNGDSHLQGDAETGEELPGATLELYAPDGTLLESWETSDIPHVITGLPVGEGYVLKEPAAPEGYELAEDIVFAVENTAEIQFVGMVDEPSPEEPEEPETPEEPTEPEEPTPTVPQTGGSRMALWVGALLILALGSPGHRADSLEKAK